MAIGLEMELKTKHKMEFRMNELGGVSSDVEFFFS